MPLGTMRPYYGMSWMNEKATLLMGTEPWQRFDWVEFVFNPTNFDVDAKGRIWVTEGVNYRRSKTRDRRVIEWLFSRTRAEA